MHAGRTGAKVQHLQHVEQMLSQMPGLSKRGSGVAMVPHMQEATVCTLQRADLSGDLRGQPESSTPAMKLSMHRCAVASYPPLQLTCTQGMCSRLCSRDMWLVLASRTTRWKDAAGSSALLAARAESVLASVAPSICLQGTWHACVMRARGCFEAWQQQGQHQ
jgi:hypothetical protein